MITKEEWDYFEKLQRKAGEIQNKFESHMTKVLHAIFEIYGGELDYWFYPPNDCERCEGSFNYLFFNGEGFINIETRSKKRLDREPYDEITENFPAKFLFMSVNEIRKVVKKNLDIQIKKEKELKAKRKKQRELRVAKKEALKESAKKKLSKEEAKALGL